ncbi:MULTISPECIES: hypothetical protein [unclassified Neisseria]|uniref:hypothetical protein n=1 Tax=unclassified Neisseria TaxID=2623750 RepID=UPI00143162D8|nr:MULTISPECIES: hypothetical protein [unclassified Neisseria]MBF0804013.1 hypothetical protein [Neisseria sp. 19428wB4_WF04]
MHDTLPYQSRMPTVWPSEYRLEYGPSARLPTNIKQVSLYRQAANGLPMPPGV